MKPLRFSRTGGGLFKLETELWLPRRREQVFPFFADAFNLETITPPWLQFEVLTPRPIEMRVGLRIDYRLRLRGFPMRWQSEITAWEPPRRFVDEQRRGPYRTWIREHTLEERDSGTLVTDVVRYDVTGGWLIHQLLVRRDVERTFCFRQAKLQELFR